MIPACSVAQRFQCTLLTSQPQEVKFLKYRMIDQSRERRAFRDGATPAMVLGKNHRASEGRRQIESGQGINVVGFA